MDTSLGMGPTAVIPGSPYYTTNGQDATGAEIVATDLQPGGWSDDRLERVLPTPTFNLDDSDLEARDARLKRAISNGLGDSFEEKKLLVPAGTLAVLHFDRVYTPPLHVPDLHFEILHVISVFHRGTRRIPGHDIRSMFKFQFFRTSSPTTPSWDHDPAADEAGMFAVATDGTDGASTQEQQAVWRSVYGWMKGAPPTATNLATGAETEGLLRQLHSPENQAERERVGAAYALGRCAADGDAIALTGLLEAVSQHDGAEESRRAAVYGLAAAGDAAVPGLVAALTGATAAHGPDVAGTIVPAVAHALGEAAREDTVAGSCATAATALVDTMKKLETRTGLYEDVSPGAVDGVDIRASQLRFALAASIQVRFHISFH